ncbi:MAG: hypothetical protein V4731_14585 [Pseudomonadota bacterium]
MNSNTSHRDPADEMVRSGDKAVERTREFTNKAFDTAESKLHDLRQSVDPMVDMLATKAQKLARQSMDLASEARQKAQESLSRYSDVTTRYVSEQPMRSVLIAAAVGAAVALIVASTRNSNSNSNRY